MREDWNWISFKLYLRTESCEAGIILDFKCKKLVKLKHSSCLAWYLVSSVSVPYSLVSKHGNILAINKCPSHISPPLSSLTRQPVLSTLLTWLPIPSPILTWQPILY